MRTQARSNNLVGRRRLVKQLDKLTLDSLHVRRHRLRAQWPQLAIVGPLHDGDIGVGVDSPLDMGRERHAQMLS